MAHLATLITTEHTKRACQTKKAQHGKDARARLAGTTVPGALKFSLVARRSTGRLCRLSLVKSCLPLTLSFFRSVQACPP